MAPVGQLLYENLLSQAQVPLVRTYPSLALQLMTYLHPETLSVPQEEAPVGQEAKPEVLLQVYEQVKHRVSPEYAPVSSVETEA